MDVKSTDSSLDHAVTFFVGIWWAALVPFIAGFNFNPRITVKEAYKSCLFFAICRIRSELAT